MDKLYELNKKKTGISLKLTIIFKRKNIISNIL
jgi:hypothetical protein